MPKIDQIANLLVPQPEVVTSSTYTPDQAIAGRELHHGRQQELTVVIPPWHANQHVQSRIVAREVRAGRFVLAYGVHDEILGPDPQNTVDSFDHIARNVGADVRLVSDLYSIRRMRYIAGSLGCAILPYVMGEQGLHGQVDLVTPGHDLASSLWHGIRTRHIRKLYEEQGIDEPKLQEQWDKLSPTYQAEHNLRRSHFRLFISKADLVIRPDGLPGFVDTLRRHGNTVETHINKHFGHYGTILKEAMLPKARKEVATT